MSNRVLRSQGEVAVWLRRCRMAVAGYVGLVLLVGLVYIAAKLIGAAFGTLLLGVVATIAGLGLGALAWGGLWLAGVVLEKREELERQLEQQRERIGLLESSMQALEVELEQHQRVHEDADAGAPAVRHVHAPPELHDAPVHAVSSAEDDEHAPPTEPPSATTPAAESASPAAGQASEDRVRAALEAGDIRAARELWQALDGGVSPTQRTDLQEQIDELTARVAAELREEFASLVRNEDFSAALRKGAEIAELLPESRMRRDFETIRAHLEARAAGARPKPGG